MEKRRTAEPSTALRFGRDDKFGECASMKQLLLVQVCTYRSAFSLISRYRFNTKEVICSG